MPEPRLLAELWENAQGDYHIRVMVGAFQRKLGIHDPAQAEQAATYEAIEVLRKIVAEFDSGEVRLAHDV